MNEALLTFEPWADWWASNLWRASWQGAVALAIAWAVVRTCTFLSPRIVCWIWRLACLKLIALLFLTVPVELRLLPAAAPKPAAVASQQAVASTVAPRDTNAPIPSITADPAFAWSSARNVLLFGWLAGFAFRFAVTVRQWGRLRRVRQTSEVVVDSAITDIRRQEAARLRIRRMPELREMQSDEGPLLAGAWRPTIVIPRSAPATFDESELRLIVAHELAHLKRHDLAWNWLPTVVGWLFFFHPLVWLLGSRWSEAQEAACDELVLQTGVTRPALYGRLLLKMAAELPVESRAGLATVGVLGSYRNLERRILAMTRVKPLSRARLLISAGIVFAIAAIAILPWRLVAQEPATVDTPEAQAEARRTATEQLLLLGLALHNHHNERKSFPPPAIIDANSKPLLSWRVALLPYFGDNNYKTLYDKFHLNEPWDSPHNKPLIAQMPAVYRCPGSKLTEPGMTVYQAPRGPATVFPGPDGVAIREIIDGTFVTIALVEVDDAHAVPWTKPDDWKFDPENPARDLGGHFPKVFLSLFCDGSAHAIEPTIAKEKLRALFSPNGGEVVNFD